VVVSVERRQLCGVSSAKEKREEKTIGEEEKKEAAQFSNLGIFVV
jgi:hypothetical protein